MLSECAGVRRRGRALETWVASAPAPRPPPPAPRHGKADLLSYHCSSAAPASPARPPPSTAAHAADTMRGSQLCDQDPLGAPSTGGCSHPPTHLPSRGLGVPCITPCPIAPRRLVGAEQPLWPLGRWDVGVPPWGPAPMQAAVAPGTWKWGNTGAKVSIHCGTSGARGWSPSLLAKAPGPADPCAMALHPTPPPSPPWPTPRRLVRPPACRGAGSPFCSFATVLIGRKGRGPIKTRPNAADGYLERTAPKPERRRARRIGWFGCIWMYFS